MSQAKAIKITINKNLCIGCGTCANLAPHIFKINDEGKSEVISEENIDTDLLKQVINSCPVGAISIEEKQTL